MVHIILLATLLSADFKQLEFLLGQWTADGGAFSFEQQLNKKIIVRHNTAPNHEDLLVIYTEGEPRAIYFDNEGHVIRYNIAVPYENRVVFESDSNPSYRLTYWLDHDSLNGKFEIAGKAYLNWSSRRKK
jgi:hypothetical protein